MSSCLWIISLALFGAELLIQDDVLAGWIIGASSAAVATRWVTLRPRLKPQPGCESATRSLRRTGALALIATELGGDSGSDTCVSVAQGEPESDPRNTV